MEATEKEIQSALRRAGLKAMATSVGIAVFMPFLFAFFLGRASFDNALLIALVSGIPGGVMIHLIFTKLRPALDKLPFVPKQLIMAASLGTTLFTFIFLSTVASAAYNYQRSPFDAWVIERAMAFMLSPFMLSLVFPIAMGSFLFFSFVAQVSVILGKGVVMNLILGKYHQPFTEERVFMFLDMKDSTTLAEELGELKFSKLVQDVFNDMTKAILTTKAEISHYIGDEAVISWTVKNGLEKNNVLRLFDIYQKTLESRRAYYEAEYGIMPRFKAGAHIGQVVTTAVGYVKSEIVFHGDVMNTTARIQGMCNELQTPFLISGELARRLSEENERLVPAGEHTLKGKMESVELVRVEPEAALQFAPQTPEIGT